ncbi:adenylate/guanylate cyclase domain-containing protein [Flavobacterium akiainvivens]|uniref:adenylate/guanylate cyclase domain-containing protein n=1 Tax=Flavobacterium akiainvivens TaxID=1202724 RepID=UPI0006C8BC81|nr:adenylate/guanylate cyclase domain-containing protein [Flavobacterium akiainvivens]SFQ09439.1 Adenylate cyclase, class 3 [Flavobacterium akiainvivens]
MLKKLLLPFVFLLFYNPCFSQENRYYQKKTDSILKKLPSVKTDSLKMDAYVKLAKMGLLTKKQDDADKYTRQALKASKSIKLYNGKGGDYLVYAEIQRLYDEQKEREYLLLAYNAAKKAGNWMVAAFSGRMLGFNYQDTNYKKAVDYYTQSAELYKKHKRYTDYCMSAQLLGMYYVSKYKLTEAADLSNTMLEIAQKHKLEKYVVITKGIQVQLYAILGNDQKALEYTYDLLKKANTGKYNYINTCSLYSYLADYYKTKKDTIKSAEFTDKLKNCNNSNLTKIDLMLNKASAYANEGNISKALAVYDKAAGLAFYEKRYDALTTAGAACYSLGDYNRSLNYHRQGLSIAKERKIAKPVAECEAYVGAACLAVSKIDNNKALLNEGITLLEKSIVFYKKVQDYIMACSIGGQLSMAYELAGNEKQALSAYKESAIYKDSAVDISTRQTLITKQAQYEYGKKEAVLKTSQKAALEHEQTNRNYAYAGVGVLVFISLGAGVAYSRKRKDNRIIAAEKKRSDDLLLNILPAEVAEELKTKGEAGAKYYDHVSIIFTDFVGFTKLSEKFSPEELLRELNYCFKAFDEIITRHNIEKIKTIGDSYMAVSGLPAGNADHATNAVHAAIEMRNFIENYKAERSAQGRVYFEMRTGINTGEVVAGIVGIKKFAYDVWGDAVNIASRMESNGEGGKINISQSTYDLVKDDFNTEYRGEIDAKGKGHIKMYFVEPKIN